MNIGAIVWPAEKKSVLAMYLNFQLNVLKELGITFPEKFRDPTTITKLFLGGEIPEDEYCSARSEWWDYLDQSKQIREFHNKNALIARMAICLFGVTEKDVPDLDEHLSWFLKVLDHFGVESDKSTAMMHEYFEFKSQQ